MNFDPSCATINAYQLTCLKNFHAQSVPDQKLRSLSPDAFLKIMGPVLPDAIKIEYDDAGRDLAQFTVYHEAWAREHKAQLLPFFENSRQIWIDFTPRQHAIDACNSLTPREQMRVDCKAAYQKAFLEVEDGTSSLPEFAAYQQLTVALQNDRLQTESPRTEMEIPLGSLVPSLCPAAGMDDAA